MRAPSLTTACVALVACSNAAPAPTPSSAPPIGLRCGAATAPAVTLGFGADTLTTPAADSPVAQIFGPQGGSHVWAAARADGLTTPVTYAFEARDAFSGARLGGGRRVGGCEERGVPLYLNALLPLGASLARVSVRATDAAGRDASRELRVWIGPAHPECVPAKNVEPTLTPVVLTNITSRREEALSLASGALLRPISNGDALVGVAVRGFAASAVTLFVQLYEETPAGRTLLRDLRAAPTNDDTNVVPVVRRTSPDCVSPVTVRLPVDATPRGPLVLSVTADDGLGRRRTEERAIRFAPVMSDASVDDAPSRDVLIADASPADASPADASPADASPADVGVVTTPTRPGLTVLGDGDLTTAAHSRELVVDGDTVFLADSNGLPVVRTAADGSVSLVNPVATLRVQHCSTASLHARTRTLACGAGDNGTLDLIDVHDPAAPRSRLWNLNEHDTPGHDPIYQVADVEVSGNSLWMAAQRNGLLRVTLDDTGMPTGLTRTGLGANVVGVVASGGRLALIDRARGLTILSERDLSTLGNVALDGPPLDVTIDGDRVAVALGSEGARLYRLVDGAPTEIARVQPRCVATAVALSGAQLAVACLTGVTLYDLSTAIPRVAGFHAARYGMLDVAFSPRGLLVSDWYLATLLRADPTGDVAYPDAPIALRLAPSRDARIVVRNPAQTAMRARWQLLRSRTPTASGTLTIAASGDATLTLPAAQIVDAGSREGNASVLFTALDAPPSTALAHASTTLVTRLDAEQPARGVVGIGDVFPTVRRTVPGTAPATLPAASAATHVMFLTVDCFLQWAQLEDMSWQRAHGAALPSPTIFYLTTRNKDPFDPSFFMDARGAADLPVVEWADYANSVPGQESEPNPVRAFEQSFFMRLPGADFPHDYAVGADGVTTDTMRAYRGRWPLRP
jgi:hypothetical protein